MKFGLTDKERSFLEISLFTPLKSIGAKVWIFGSRARGDHKKFSDIDILFQIDKKKLPNGFLSRLKENLENSNFSYKVDLVDFDEIAKNYRENILKDMQEV